MNNTFHNANRLVPEADNYLSDKVKSFVKIDEYLSGGIIVQDKFLKVIYLGQRINGDYLECLKKLCDKINKLAEIDYIEHGYFHPVSIFNGNLFIYYVLTAYPIEEIEKKLKELFPLTRTSELNPSDN